jgi:hypothetical protein
MYRAIEISNLLVYSNIYGLGLTEQDQLHLQAVHTLYNDQLEGDYIYKPTNKNCDLTVHFTGYASSGPPSVTVARTDKLAAQHGYPMFVVGLRNKAYFKTLPNVKDIPLIKDLLAGIEFAPDTMYTNVDEFKQKLVQSEFSSVRNYTQLQENFIEGCFWAADKRKNLDRKAITLYGKKGTYEDMPTYVHHIVAVLQLDTDTRLAFYIIKQIYSQYGPNVSYDLKLGMYYTRPGDECYNYTDPDKYISHLDDTTHRPKVVYTEANPVFPKDKEVVSAYRRGKNFITVDSATLNLLTTRWARKQQELANEQAAIVKLEKKISEKIKQLDKGETFTYNDMAFTSAGFEYEGQSISDKNVKMQEVLNHFSGNYSEDYLNFDRVLDTWLKTMFQNLIKNKKTSGKIGDVDYNIVLTVTKSKPDTNGRISETRSFRVNGYRINKDEVQQVLARAICFPNTAEFDTFCKSVAGCSLRYHKLLASGLVVGGEHGVRDEIFDEQVQFKLELERVKNRNFLVVGAKKWKVVDTNRLLTLVNAQDMTRVISILLAPGVVGMTGEEIKDVLEGGKKALIEQKQREEELLNATIQQFNIERLDQVTCGNGKMLSGYLIRGHMRDYLVEESKCMVFEYPSGRYICMVDKGQNEHSNTARLVNRFYALSNDSKLAKEINTL